METESIISQTPSTTKRRYECDLCSVTTGRKFDLKRHKMLKHGNKVSLINRSQSMANVGYPPRKDDSDEEDDSEDMDVEFFTEPDILKYTTSELKTRLGDAFWEEMDDPIKEKGNLVERFKNTTETINWLTNQLVDCRKYYLGIIKELQNIPVNKKDRGIFKECIKDYVENLTSMKDLWFEFNIDDETGDWVNDDDEESEELVFESDEEDGDSEELVSESDEEDIESLPEVKKNGEEGGYDAYYKGFHNFFIKFEDVIKEKGDLVEGMLLQEKKEAGMDADSKDEVHRHGFDNKVDENKLSEEMDKEEKAQNEKHIYDFKK